MHKKALEIQPNSSASINNLSNYYKSTGQLDKAIQMYKQALRIKSKIDTTAAIIYTNLASSYRVLYMNEEALECAIQAVNYKRYSSSLMNLGFVQYAYGDTASSFKTIREVANLPDESVANLSWLSSVFYEYIDPDEGMAFIKRLKSKEMFREEDYPEFKTYEAIELQKKGSYDSADIILENTLEFYLSKFEQGFRFQYWLYPRIVIRRFTTTQFLE